MDILNEDYSYSSASFPLDDFPLSLSSTSSSSSSPSPPELKRRIENIKVKCEQKQEQGTTSETAFHFNIKTGKGKVEMKNLCKNCDKCKNCEQDEELNLSHHCQCNCHCHLNCECSISELDSGDIDIDIDTVTSETTMSTSISKSISKSKSKPSQIPNNESIRKNQALIEKTKCKNCEKHRIHTTSYSDTENIEHINDARRRRRGDLIRFSELLLFLTVVATGLQSVTMHEAPGCSKPLGLMTGEIEDWQLAASSVKPGDSSCASKYARIHQPGSHAWCPNSPSSIFALNRSRDENQTQNQLSNHHSHHSHGRKGKHIMSSSIANELVSSLPHDMANARSNSSLAVNPNSENHWILVDLGVRSKVSGILTQGRGDELEWVTAFTLAYSEDAFKWDFIHDFYGKKKTFRGNSDSHSIRSIWLHSPINARFIRVHIHKWHRYPSLRLEILGCQECASLVSGPGIGSGLTASSYGAWARRNSCQPDDAHIHSHRAWCSRHNNAHQWLQLDLGPPTLVTGILSRGRADTGRKQWVTSYTISYSNDTRIWYYYKETNHLNPKIFGGNMDKMTERRHYLNSPFVASYVRLHPTSWHNHIAIRAAVLGCPTRHCPPNFFRLNQYSPCIENLAYKKEVWSNDKRHFWKDWKYGHASLAVDGLTDTILPKCAIIDNYYAETPIWMVDLGRKHEITGVVIVTWQGDGQDKKPTYRDYVLNLERLTVFVSNKPRLDSPALDSETKCGSISRNNNALFHPKLRFECVDEIESSTESYSSRGRYVYIQSTSVPNRWDRIFNSIFCEVYVY